MIIYNSMVKSVLTYGAEIWSLVEVDRRRFTATEVDALRRSARISKLDRKTNEYVREKMEAPDTILDEITRKQLTCYGHAERMDPTRLPKIVTNRKPEGRKKRGRPRRTWKDGITKAMCDRSKRRRTERWKAIEYGSRKASPDVLKPLQHEQKGNIQTVYQNHYLQYPSQLPSEAKQWVPSTPSTQPPTPPPPQHYSVTVSIQQPDALILLCQVQEPLEHISWYFYPCPNHHSAGEGTLIADGTTVSNTSLYEVRIIGQNGVFISELHILQNPLQLGIAGLYQCEAWPQGPNKDVINHQTSSRYHDEFIIGGHLMLKSCFYDPHWDKYYYQHYGPPSYSHKLQKHYRTPRNKLVPQVSENMIGE